MESLQQSCLGPHVLSAGPSVTSRGRRGTCRPCDQNCSQARSDCPAAWAAEEPKQVPGREAKLLVLCWPEGNGDAPKRQSEPRLPPHVLLQVTVLGHTELSPRAGLEKMHQDIHPEEGTDSPKLGARTPLSSRPPITLEPTV